MFHLTGLNIIAEKYPQPTICEQAPLFQGRMLDHELLTVFCKSLILLFLFAVLSFLLSI